MTAPLPSRGSRDWYAWAQDIDALARTGGARFDPRTSLYNFKGANTRRMRAALALARNDTGIARLAFLGDSATAGFGTTRGTDDPVTKLRQQFSRAKFRTGELIHLYSNLTEPRITYTGTWVDHQGLTSGWRVASTTGATASYTGTGRYFEIVTWGQQNGWSYQIDGGTSVGNTQSGVAGPQLVTIDAGTDASHTFKITTTGPDTFWYAAGIRPATGIVVENAGVSGVKTSDVLTASVGNAVVMSDAAYPRADVVFVELGANDAAQSVPVATYKTNLLAIVDKFLAYNADVVLVATHTTVAGATTWAPYLTPQYEVADLRGLPLLDLADRFGWGTGGDDFDGTPYDMSTDGAHLTAAGNSAKAMAWLDLITPGLGPL